jgi:hypothetical protein
MVERTGSKKCLKQADVALDFALDLVTKCGVDARRITVLAPYKANVDYLTARRRKLPKYSPLIGMIPASTVDAFQGQENDIIIVVMGTTFPKPGPGFTTDKHRLNVLLTRQKCGLVVVDDINIHAGKKGKKGKRDETSFQVITLEGEMCPVRAAMLVHIYDKMVEEGRVIHMDVEGTTS